ncbi:hypothetical protein JHK85_024862 [Glycine max]|nr:hypothetical protein JHK85_024862 [Glycine max]KAG5012114.1 hypothetical protein JHK86_024375 [Glycine max]
MCCRCHRCDLVTASHRQVLHPVVSGAAPPLWRCLSFVAPLREVEFQSLLSPTYFGNSHWTRENCLQKSIKLVLLEWRIEFEDNSKLEADVVVLATGFDGKKKLKSILPHPLRSLLDYPSGVMRNLSSRPGVEKMLSQTLEEMDVMKRSTRFYKRHCNSTHSINHSDEICEDMGWSSWRKKNWITEAFSPYSSEDYRKKD